MKNDLNILARLKYGEEKARTEREEQQKELNNIKNNIKNKIEYLLTDLYNKNNVKDKDLLNYYYNNKYELIDLIYYSDNSFTNYDLETIKNLINDLLYQEIKARTKSYKEEIKESKQKVSKIIDQIEDKMLKILIDESKKNSYSYIIKHYKAILFKYYNLNDINNLDLSSQVIAKFKRIFKEEIKEEQEQEKEEKQEVQRVNQGLGFFGTSLAILSGFIDYASKKR